MNKPRGLARRTPKVNGIPSSEKIENSRSPLIFISHDTRDAEIAEAFSKLLGSVSTGMLKSFRSSDKKGGEGIEYGVEWYPEIMKKIDSASDVVCLLTPNSIERPWILYEAGVAKGKSETPVFGIAIGVNLSVASTGPFAQFQNCQGDEDSVQKLVGQLIRRLQGAEPDEDTVRMQVEIFVKKSNDLVKSKVSLPAKTVQQEAADIDLASVPKLFEEIKVMFRDLPRRLDGRSELSRRTRVPTEFIEDISMMLGHSTGEPTLALLVLLGGIRQDVPWLYDLAWQYFIDTRDGHEARARRSGDILRQAFDLAAHTPLLQDIGVSRNLRHTFLIARKLMERTEVKARPSKPSQTDK